MNVQVESSAWRPTLKRSRSQSPAGHRKRGPEHCSTANTAPYGRGGAASPQFHRAVSFSTALGSSSSGSQPRDWVSLTENLQLATPPGTSPHPEEEYAIDTDMAMSQEVEMESDTPPQHFIEHLASASFHAPTSYDQTHSHTVQDAPPPVPPSSPVPPHRLPPLYQNLAGSPVPLPPSRPHSPNASMSSAGMARSLSDGSSDSAMSTGGFTDPRPRQTYHYPASPRRTGSAAPVLTMGFRPDCEKCVARVPGHYSHFASPSNHDPHPHHVRLQSPPLAMSFGP